MEHQLKQDILTVLNHQNLTRECVEHFIENRHRLVRGVYHTPDGQGCFMNILTETLPRGQNIRSRNDLINFFGVAQGKPGESGYVSAYDSKEYQPAKWIVRMVDRQICVDILARYGSNAPQLSERIYDIILETCREYLAELDSQKTRLASEPKVAAETRPMATTLS